VSRRWTGTFSGEPFNAKCGTFKFMAKGATRLDMKFPK
jgi:hypothetical protein